VADWLNIDPDEPSHPGLAEFEEMIKLYESLEVFASLRTLNAAYELMLRTDVLRINRSEMVHADNEDPEEWNKQIGEMYRIKSDADHAFVRAARLEMGLRPLSGNAPGYPKWRKKRWKLAKRLARNENRQLAAEQVDSTDHSPDNADQA